MLLTIIRETWDNLLEMAIRGETIPGENVASFYEEHCTYLPAMLGWFLFSSLLSAYNKKVFGDGHMAFPCPLLLTSIHFLIQWIFSHLACELFPVYLGTERVKRMDWKEWLLISLPCGMITSFDVGLSNLSLVSITITFYTMIKSSTPIFVVGWAYLFGIEKITWSLLGVVVVIALGECLTVLGEVEFVMKGFLLCLCASLLSGARWTLVQLKLQTMDPPLKTTLVTMRLLSPCMFFSMLLFSLIVERPWDKFSDAEPGEALRVLVLGLIGGVFAISMVLCEFYLILEASAIIMMIGGVMKEMCTILLGYVSNCFCQVYSVSFLHYHPDLLGIFTQNLMMMTMMRCTDFYRVTLFGDQLNAINVTGFCIVFLGVVLYKVAFHLQKEAKLEQSLLEKSQKENLEGSLLKDKNGESDYVSDRSIELVDRSPAKPRRKVQRKGMTVESVPTEDPDVDDGNESTGIV